MDDLTLPTAITNFITTTNDADSEQFVAQFAPDAFLDDWGNVYRGPAEIAKWNQTDNIGKESQFALQDFTQDDATTWTVHLNVTGKGFNGVSPFRMTIKNDLLASVEILPD
ncbi:nuclear transport factor 2 family protein [Levilactobacillus yonginensis]|uniref:nuclear transport factor 2 family protein n=1 Tax=Levilactobacillus yonginensis TaxID=1054041 RepID=UPI000F7B4096|nr:nuclear transport factor 2 family protein [Levilactobacillus yonginensis]